MNRVIYLRPLRQGRDQQGLQQQLERVFQYEWGHPKAMVVIAQHQGVWRPPTDVYETEQAVVVKVELPGMRDVDIEIMLDERSLRITGMRPELRDAQVVCYHQMGISYGAFEVEVFLARRFDDDRVTAVYDDGVLLVHLPKVAEPPRGARHRVALSE